MARALRTRRVAVVLTMREAELLWSAGLHVVGDEVDALGRMSRADYNGTWRALEKLRASVRIQDQARQASGPPRQR